MSRVLRTVADAISGNGKPIEQPQAEQQDEFGEIGAVFERSLKAATRTFREQLLTGMGRDETFHNEFFKPGSEMKRQFYSIMAAYGTGEMLKLQERLGKPKG